MRRAILIAGLLTVLAGLGASAQAGGLQLGTPPAERSQGREGPPPALPRPGPGRGSEGVGLLPVPDFLQGITATISQAQRRLNQTLSQEMRRIQQTGSPAAILTVSVVAFLYGVLHAAGPGHGKLVVSAFFLGREARIIKGVMMGGLVSLLQTLSAIAIVLVLVFILGQGGFDVVQQSVWVEVTSYGLIVLIGLYLIYAALTGRHLGHHHGESSHGHAESDEPLAHRGSGAGRWAHALCECHHHHALCPRQWRARHRHGGHAHHGRGDEHHGGAGWGRHHCHPHDTFERDGRAAPRRALGQARPHLDGRPVDHSGGVALLRQRLGPAALRPAGIRALGLGAILALGGACVSVPPSATFKEPAEIAGDMAGPPEWPLRLRHRRDDDYPDWRLHRDDVFRGRGQGF